MNLLEAAQLQHATAVALNTHTRPLSGHEIDTLTTLRDLAEAELSRHDVEADDRIPFPHLSQQRFDERKRAMAAVREDFAVRALRFQIERHDAA